jgi:putative SOS response-associated peptidase YedK
VRESEKGREGVLMRWGLTPSWAASLADGVRNFNARSETVASKPTFREAFKHRRCIVPISGFYEWRVLREQRRQPHYITRRDREPIALAGLWERWAGPAETADTFTILTTSPNALIKPLHDRMPVILAPDDFDRWLGSNPLSEAETARIFALRDDHPFEAFPVGPMVSNARNEGSNLIVRVTEIHPDDGFLF